MNNKIPLRVLAQQMAQASGLSENVCQEFVKALFRLVSEDLYRGQTIVVDGIGSFSVDTAFSDPIQFEVDANLASELNAPFSFFQPMTLSGSLDQEEAEKFNEITVEIDSELDESDTVASIDDANVIDSGAVPEESDSIENNAIGKTESEDGQEDETIMNPESEDEIAEVTPPAIPISAEDSLDCEMNNSNDTSDIPNNELSSQDSVCEIDQNQADDELISQTIQPIDDVWQNESEHIYIPEEEEEYVEYHQRRGNRFWIGFFIGLLTGLVLAAVALAIYVVQFLNYPLSNLN